MKSGATPWFPRRARGRPPRRSVAPGALAHRGALRWPPEDTLGGEAEVTYLELALDFEGTMGCELPFPKQAGATGPGAFVHAGDAGVAGRSPAKAADWARLFGFAWRALERLCGKQFHPGRKDKLTRGLQPLGSHQPLSGFSRRPVFRGG